MDNTLNILLHQLKVIKRLIDEDKKEGVYKYNYLIHTDKLKFLDVDGLKNFITTVEVKNSIVFNEIVMVCNSIIDFWNDESLSLKEKKLEKNFHVIKENEQGFFSSVNDFYAISFDNQNKLSTFNTIHGKETFVKNYVYDIQNIYTISCTCNAIISWITGALPETKSKFLLKNSIAKFASSSFIEKIISKIIVDNYSVSDVIHYVEKKTTKTSRDVIINELMSTYRNIKNEFMFEVKEEDIVKALELFENSLEYIYISKGDLKNIKSFIRNINGIETVYNVDGSMKEKNEHNVQLVYLNNMMIDYFDGFFANEIKGFEKISVLKNVCEYFRENQNKDSELFEGVITNVNVNSQKSESINNLKYKSQIWFKVGVLFANGEMNKYYNKGRTGFANGYSAPKVAKEFGNTSYNKFILASINNYDSDNQNGDKNIFNSKDKMEKIIAHCKELSMPIDEYFLSRLPIE